MKKGKKKKSYEPLPWLPIDSRLLSPVLSFGRVGGIAKLFLLVEFACAILVVVGTMSIMLMTLVSRLIPR